MSFLEGLNENYAAIRSQILLLDPLPPLHQAFFNGFSTAILPDPTILAASSSQALSKGRFKSKNAPSKSGNQKHWTYCNRTNHTVENCYFKHRFPPRYKSKKALHLAIANDQTTHSAHSSLPGITPEQLQGLLALLPQSQSTATAHAAHLASTHNVTTYPNPGFELLEDDWQS